MKIRGFKRLSNFDLNPRILASLVLFGGIFFIMFGTPYLFPHKPINLNESKTLVVYKNVTVTKFVTPTPDGHIYFAGEYQNGTRLLQRPFSWVRYNVTGYKDMKVTNIIYDYMYFNKLHWFNPTTYKYVEFTPNGADKQFLLIFIYTVMDNIAGDDSRMWLVPPSSFAVFDGFNTTSNIEYPYQWRFRELENTPSFDKAVNVQAYKSFRAYSNSEFNSATAGEYNDVQYYLRGGESNAINGFLIFEVSNQSLPQNTLALAKFHDFGYSNWKLSS